MSAYGFPSGTVEALRIDIQDAIAMHLGRTCTRCAITIDDFDTEISRSIDGRVLVQRTTELSVSVELEQLESTTTTGEPQ